LTRAVKTRTRAVCSSHQIADSGSPDRAFRPPVSHRDDEICAIVGAVVGGVIGVATGGIVGAVAVAGLEAPVSASAVDEVRGKVGVRKCTPGEPGAERLGSLSHPKPGPESTSPV